MAKLITEETIQATLKLIADDIKAKSDAEHLHGYEDLEDLTTEADIDEIWGTESSDTEVPEKPNDGLTSTSLTLGEYVIEFNNDKKTLDFKYIGE